MADLQINERIWGITCNHRAVAHMFDTSGSETFDPTQAVELYYDGDIFHLVAENDVFTFTLLADGSNG